MQKLKVALVIPTHFGIHSSLNNLLKVYRYSIKNRNIEVTIFTDKKMMSNKITTLIKNKDLATKMAKNGRKHILDNFSIENVALKIYKTIAG